MTNIAQPSVRDRMLASVSAVGLAGLLLEEGLK
jgi:hypothetical protein